MKVKKIVAALGGGATLAAEIGITRQAVYHWEKVNHIPRAWELFLRKTHPEAFV